MKKVALFALLLVPTFFWAAPIPDEYPINVHVTSSYLVTEINQFRDPVPIQKLNVVIDGKKYELKGDTKKLGLLAPGDYKAKLVEDEHKTTYASNQAYEFSFPDQKTRKFFVTGQIE